MSTITESDYRRLKQEVEESRAEAQRAKGALDQLMTQLKQEFECETLKEAKTLLDDLTKKQERLHQKFEEALTDYRRKWKRSSE